MFLVGLALAGLGVALLDVSVERAAIVPCPVRALTDVPCPGCGMTRACLSMARGDLAAAWGHHPFSFALVALAALVAIAPVRARSWALRCPRPWRLAALALVLALLVARWLALILADSASVV